MSTTKEAERLCHQMLDTIRAQYERDAKPWMDMLVRIQMAKAPYYWVRTDSDIRMVGPGENQK